MKNSLILLMMIITAACSQVAPKASMEIPMQIYEGRLLTGIPTNLVQNGEHLQPKPIMIRIMAMEEHVLLRSFSSNGQVICHLVGEGFGEKETQRLQVRLLKLTCNDKEGPTILEQDVKGYVMDDKGMIGLKGDRYFKEAGIIEVHPGRLVKIAFTEVISIGCNAFKDEKHKAECVTSKEMIADIKMEGGLHGRGN